MARRGWQALREKVQRASSGVRRNDKGDPLGPPLLHFGAGSVAPVEVVELRGVEPLTS